MPISWNSDFDLAQVTWYLVSAVVLIATLVPFSGKALSCGARVRKPFMGAEDWFSAVILNIGLWVLIYQSLAFGPSLGTMPAQSDEARAPQAMETMITESERATDVRHLIGRGGFIGDLAIAGFASQETQGNSEAPLFSTRRPLGTVPLATMLFVQLTVYLAAVLAIMHTAQAESRTNLRLIVFAALWGGAVYCPSIHWIWGDGWLTLRNAIDTGGACYLLIVSTAVFTLRLSEPQDAGIDSHRHGQTTDSDGQIVAVGMLQLGLLVLITTTAFSSLPQKSVAIYNGLAASIGGYVVSLILKGTHRSSSENKAASIVWYTAYGLASVSAGVLLFDLMTSFLVGGMGAVAVFFLEKSVFKIVRFGNNVAFPRGLMIATSAGFILSASLGTSANGVHHWDGRPVQSLLHGPADLLFGQTLTIITLISASALGTLVLSKCLFSARRPETS